MRNMMTADWAFGLRGAIENTVRDKYPTDLRRWPLLQSFDFEAYRLEDEDYFILIIRDKIAGVTAGPGMAVPFPHTDYPPFPTQSGDAVIWQKYLNSKFSLSNENAAVLIPIHDSGSSDPSKDFELFSKMEQEFWVCQIRMIVDRQKMLFAVTPTEAPSVPQNITFNVSGTNARINIQSSDNSNNIVQSTVPEVFEQLRDATQSGITDQLVRERILKAIDIMDSAYDQPTFTDKYRDFIALVSNHITVYAPFLTALAGLL